MVELHPLGTTTWIARPTHLIGDNSTVKARHDVAKFYETVRKQEVKSKTKLTFPSV